MSSHAKDLRVEHETVPCDRLTKTVAEQIRDRALLRLERGEGTVRVLRFASVLILWATAVATLPAAVARDAAGVPNAIIGPPALSLKAVADVPPAFSKTAPVTGATGQPTSLLLSWQGNTATDGYDYCFDTTNNDTCDGSWISRLTLFVSITGLSGATNYYWQVRARNVAGTTEANGGAWWSFRTVDAPPAFSKSGPATGATGQPTSLMLSWQGNTATDGYDYCFDTTNNDTCDGSWIPRLTISVSITGLSGATNYYWQVRARNVAGTTEANGGAWWSFRTRRGPAGVQQERSRHRRDRAAHVSDVELAGQHRDRRLRLLL